MAGGGARAGAGRKKHEFDPAMVFKLAGINCTDEEIADVIGVTRESIRKWKRRTIVYEIPDEMIGMRRGTFAELLAMGRSVAKASLRRKLHAQADSKPAAAIFLAKNLLGYKDQPIIAVNVQGPAKEAVPKWLEDELKQQKQTREAGTPTDGATTRSGASGDSTPTSVAVSRATAARSGPASPTQ